MIFGNSNDFRYQRKPGTPFRQAAQGTLDYLNEGRQIRVNDGKETRQQRRRKALGRW